MFRLAGANEVEITAITTINKSRIIEVLIQEVAGYETKRYLADDSQANEKRME